ncbi:hypothetical protein T484DRAFT_1845078, partial [Baffinella frigidus]
MSVDPAWLEAVDNYVVTCRACMTVQWRDPWRPASACPAGHSLCRPCYAMYIFEKRPQCPICRRDVFRIVGQRIHPSQLETPDTEKFTCPVCLMVLEHPSAGCPEGHLSCKQCLLDSASCPICKHPTTDERSLFLCRMTEKRIWRLRIRCRHGAEEGAGAQTCAWRAR